MKIGLRLHLSLGLALFFLLCSEEAFGALMQGSETNYVGVSERQGVGIGELNQNLPLLAQSSVRSRRRNAAQQRNRGSQGARRGADQQEQLVSSNGRRGRGNARNADNSSETADRRRVLSTEKRFTQKKGAPKDTNIDFDEIDITGQRKDPGVGFVRSTVSGSGQDFINIRKEWHDAMVQSTLLVD